MKAAFFLRSLVSVTIVTLLPGLGTAEPCLLTYPIGLVTFRYNPSQYQTLGPADLGYEAAFGVSGEVLWDVDEERIAYEVYQAPGLSDFRVTSGKSTFHVGTPRATIRVDGFFSHPRQLVDVYLQFRPYPASAVAEIYVEGERVRDLRYHIPRIVVQTPTSDGFYSDGIGLQVEWAGAQYIEMFAFADRNGNRVFDGDPCVCAVMEDLTVPIESKTWGAIKSLYR